MRHLIRLDHWAPADLEAVVALADAYRRGAGPTTNGCAAMFFPPTSLRTRVSFERGAELMGLQPIALPADALDKPEALGDVAGYLASWVDVLIVRHPGIAVLEALAAPGLLPVVNAMTDENHPCEVLSDLYTLGQDRDIRGLRFVFVGPDGNMLRAWAEAARAFDLDLVQCCPDELATPGCRWSSDVRSAVRGADVILTDAPGAHAAAMAPFTITTDLLALAPADVKLAPTPPFERGREVSAEAVAAPAFVGYRFKVSLLPVQQAVMAYTLGLG